MGLVAIAVFSFVTAWRVFTAIAATLGLRASEEYEMAGLDISEHGMFGYPERFIEVVGAESGEAHRPIAPIPAVPGA